MKPRAPLAADPRERDEQLAQQARSEAAAEAREWLGASHHDHEVLVVGNEAARELVDDLYKAGAEKVFITEIARSGSKFVSDSFVIELPREAAARKRVFPVLEEYIEMTDSDDQPDSGQSFALITVD